MVEITRIRSIGGIWIDCVTTEEFDEEQSFPKAPLNCWSWKVSVLMIPIIGKGLSRGQETIDNYNLIYLRGLFL